MHPSQSSTESQQFERPQLEQTPSCRRRSPEIEHTRTNSVFKGHFYDHLHGRYTVLPIAKRLRILTEQIETDKPCNARTATFEKQDRKTRQLALVTNPQMRLADLESPLILRWSNELV